MSQEVVSHMAVLAELFGPSETGVDLINWSEIDSKLNLRLPSDYIQWAEVYPGLYVDGFLRILHPLNFFGTYTREQISEELSGIREIDPQICQEVFDPRGNIIGEELPIYSCFPQEGGVLPWGNTDNGDMLLWLTEGHPDSWKVVVVDGDVFSWQEFDCGFSDFLVGLFTNRFSQKILPDDLNPAIKEFQGFSLNSRGRRVPVWRATSRWMEHFDQQLAEREQRNRPPE